MPSDPVTRPAMSFAAASKALAAIEARATVCFSDAGICRSVFDAIGLCKPYEARMNGQHFGALSRIEGLCLLVDHLALPSPMTSEASTAIWTAAAPKRRA